MSGVGRYCSLACRLANLFLSNILMSKICLACQRKSVYSGYLKGVKTHCTVIFAVF